VAETAIEGQPAQCAISALAARREPSAPTALLGSSTVVGLQRRIGNAAVARLVARARPAPTAAPVGRSSLVLQRRCGCGSTGTCACSEETSESDREAEPIVQRIPAYSPNPAWSSKGAGQCADCCEPYTPELLATTKWHLWSTLFPDEAGSRTSCAEVTQVWNRYFAASGGRLTFDESANAGSCVVRSLKNDDDHLPHEDPHLRAVEAALPTLVAGMQPGESATRPLSQVVGTTPMHPQIVFNFNTRAGGSLFGGVGDSEHGPDDRLQDGTIELETFRDGAAMGVRSSVLFSYTLIDGVDFCPGNTGERAPSAILPFVLRQVSKLEASGMARDVGLTARYTRRRFNVPRALPIPEPPPPPPNPIRLPSRILFEFNSSTLKPGADVEIGRALGQLGDPARIRVVGHTDSKGSDDFNQRLSEARAAAVRAEILRQRPELGGRVSTEGRGEREPVEPNEVSGADNPAGRAQNRRVEISAASGP
jgi:outer membrane protein OmpA-like peptidoglycan-associated protein